MSAILLAVGAFIALGIGLSLGYTYYTLSTKNKLVAAGLVLVAVAVWNYFGSSDDEGEQIEVETNEAAEVEA